MTLFAKCGRVLTVFDFYAAPKDQVVVRTSHIILAARPWCIFTL